jgi:hypothetical protein
LSKDLDKYKERNRPTDKYDDGQLIFLSIYEYVLKNATSLKSQFDNWCLALSIISFNGSKYDMNLMKQFMHKFLEDYGETVSFSIKKANSYMPLKIQHLQF